MLTVTSVLFYDKFTGLAVQGSPDLIAAPNDQVYAIVKVSALVATQGISFTFNSTNQTIVRNDCPFGSFIKDGFLVGDIIDSTGTSGGTYDFTGSVITAVTDTMITVASGVPATGTSTGNIFDNTPITALDYQYNMVPSNAPGTFLSMSDTGQIQIGTVSGITSSSGVTAMPYVGASKAWNDGSVSVTGNGTSGYVQKFTITHTFFAKPGYLTGWYSAMLAAFQGNAIPPGNTDFQYTYKVNARYTTNGPVTQTTGQQVAHSKTGWYNTLVNLQGANSVPKYYFESIAYKNHATSAVLSAIDYENDTDVTIIVDSHVADIIANTPFQVVFMWLPQNPNAYQANQNDYYTDLFATFAMNKIGAGSVNDNKHATGYQVMTGVAATAISTTRMSITFTVSFGATVKALFANNPPTDRNYAFVVTAQNANVAKMSTTDRNAVLCDVNVATTNLDDVTLLNVITDGTTDIHFFRYPDVEVNPVTNLADFIGAYTYGKYQFQVKDSKILQNISVQILAYNSGTGATFPLLSWAQDTSSTYNGKYVTPNIVQSAGYNLPAGDYRNNRSLTRNPGNDTAGYWAYDLYFGFQMGYQVWQQLAGQADPAFVGQSTNDWATYSNKAGWAIIYQITANILDPTNGHVTTFIQGANVQAADPSNNGAYTSVITTQDNTGNDIGGIIASDIQTQVTATLTGDFSAFPAGYSAYTAELTLLFRDGVQETYDRSTTEEYPLPTSLWTGQPVITVVSSSEITIVGLVDLTIAQLLIRGAFLFAKLGYKV